MCVCVKAAPPKWGDAKEKKQPGKSITAVANPVIKDNFIWKDHFYSKY